MIASPALELKTPQVWGSRSTVSCCEACTISTSFTTRKVGPTFLVPLFAPPVAVECPLLAPKKGVEEFRFPSRRRAPLQSTLDGDGCVRKCRDRALEITSSMSHSQLVVVSLGSLGDRSFTAMHARRKKSEYTSESVSRGHRNTGTSSPPSTHKSRTALSRETTLVYAPRSTAGIFGGFGFGLGGLLGGIGLSLCRVDITHGRDRNSSLDPRRIQSKSI